jgi:hypothetical protein
MTASFAQIPFRPQPPMRRTATMVARPHVTLLTFPLRMRAAILTFALAAAVLPSAWAQQKVPPPSPDLLTAEAALARAESVDAQQYAPDALLRARSTFGQAQARWAERRKPDATALAQLAAAQADFAYARSREASVQSQLMLRRSEVRELRAKLGIEGGP